MNSDQTTGKNKFPARLGQFLSEASSGKNTAKSHAVNTAEAYGDHAELLGVGATWAPSSTEVSYAVS